ncbi:hypothetical protein ABZ667_26480 [Streptomyces lavendulae]|uniref:hypothetical protein n=1 Tax=Streptomyces lavendulae TaxID=1914 RepID=UPI0033F4E7E5
MPRLRFGRRAGLSFVTAGSALVLAFAVAVPASGAHGTVTVTLGDPLLTAPRVAIKDPVDNHCYTVEELFPEAPEGSTFSSVSNRATTPINVYEGDACSGAVTATSPMRYGMFLGGAPIRSIKILPGPSVPTMPTTFTTPPA